MFNKILIANRSEIACRIIRTARKMGIKTVAIYSSIESDALHARLADEAYCVGGPIAKDSYLNQRAIIDIAMQSGAEAIHPGYGFLSEDPQFAAACKQHNLIFIGPTVAAMEAMASKQIAKQRLENTQVPLTPGYHGADQSDARLLQEARNLGFPVLLKAAYGGGGKGMRTVVNAADFSSAVTAARRESLAYFANDTLLIEKLIIASRHIEIQLMADEFGNVVHLFERDCSVQRRHQKVIEEAPAPNLNPQLRQQLITAAINVARAIAYRGAGTVEFLVDENERFYFMEMNTRLQVEHPVTEFITGLDLVEWQFRIAAHEPLPCKQEDISENGHAIECRVYAEDPEQEGLPSTGQIHFLHTQTNPYVRIDTGIECNSTITPYYDAMIAKIIAWGKTRAEAIQRLQDALASYYLGGVKTNCGLLQAILNHPTFYTAQVTTNFLTETPIVIAKSNPINALYYAACVDYLQKTQDPQLNQALGFRMHATPSWSVRYQINQQPEELSITPRSPNSVTFTRPNDSPVTFYNLRYQDNLLQGDDGQQRHSVYVETLANSWMVYSSTGSCHILPWLNHVQRDASKVTNEVLIAPMPSTVVALFITQGEPVIQGQALLVLEAMKMEHTLYAPHDGIVTAIFYNIGEQVAEGILLLELQANDHA